MATVPLHIAAKHAVIGLTKSVAMEFAKSGVRINAVCPGAVQTEMYERFTGRNADMEKLMISLHPIGRTGTPDEIASAVFWLCTEATFTTGQSIVLDGGFTTQ